MSKIIVNIAAPFDRQPAFGYTQWVHWYSEGLQLWTGHSWQNGKVSRKHHCPVFVGMENSTHNLQGTIISVAPRYKGEGQWEWSTHLECDVPPLSDSLGAADLIPDQNSNFEKIGEEK